MRLQATAIKLIKEKIKFKYLISEKFLQSSYFLKKFSFGLQ